MKIARAQEWRLSNASGLCVRIGSIGAALIAVETPDRAGDSANVVLGLDHADAYHCNPGYLGVTIGRFANRIRGAQFCLDGHTHQLDANDGPNCLHGGSNGWHLRHWRGETTTLDAAPAIRLTLTSPDGDGGFPGEVMAVVTYALSDDNILIVEHAAQCDAATPFNPTQHSYWNLSGQPGSTIHDHALSIDAESWLPIDAALLPHGPPTTVMATPLDFAVPRLLGDALRVHADAVQAQGGYDHCLILRGQGLRDCAMLSHPHSGRTLTIRTDRPAIQLYTGQWLSGTHQPFAGVALETQAYPDAPNRPDFPDATLRPGTPFRSRTEFVFGAR